VPTYQYACTSCGEPLEAVQKFTDDPLTVCPVCGSPLRKVYSAVGIVFKGSGFYRTDSRNGSGNGKDKPVTAGEGSSSNGDGGGSQADKTSGSSGEKSGSTPGSGDGKPAPKAEKATGSGTGAKVA
jgi:putative FmdB family regulatory protein